METRPGTRPEPRHVLRLARGDKRGAEALLAGLPFEEQVAIVCETPLAGRARMLELLPEPEAVIPMIPEAELCFTVKAVGLDDASWILEHASADQLTACADLDAWNGLVPDLESMQVWLANFAEAGDDTLFRASHALDPEFWVRFLRDQILVHLKPNDDESWQPPEGGLTLDGQFYFVPIRPDDDVAALHTLLRVLFEKDYWLYFRLLQGTIWELDNDLEEWALRWRTGRLEDLGFPSWDEAMQIYGFIRPEERGSLPEAPHTLEVAEWQLPVWIPQLPAPAETQHSIFRAAAGLDPEERRSFYYAFIALANKVAVADQLPLGDSETLPKAIDKSARLGSLGLDAIAAEQGLTLEDVLRRGAIERLFCVGANLDPEMARLDRTGITDEDTEVENGDEPSI